MELVRMSVLVLVPGILSFVLAHMQQCFQKIIFFSTLHYITRDVPSNMYQFVLSSICFHHWLMNVIVSHHIVRVVESRIIESDLRNSLHFIQLSLFRFHYQWGQLIVNFVSISCINIMMLFLFLFTGLMSLNLISVFFWQWLLEIVSSKTASVWTPSEWLSIWILIPSEGITVTCWFKC